MDRIEELQKAILTMHGCASTHLETVSVGIALHDETVWEGDVEIFEVRGHPEAKRCYAWRVAAGYVAVLELPPVTSPETAVINAYTQEITIPREAIKKSGLN